MKQKFNLLILSLGLLVFSSSCIKDDIYPEASLSDSFNGEGVSVTHLKRSQIPEHLTKSLSTTPSLKSSGNENVLIASFGTVYLDNVLKVTTVDGFENYSFFVAIDDQNPLTFYNLIVKFNNQQLVEPPFLRRYTMTSTFYASYSQGLEGFDTFQGTLEKIFITDTLAIGDLIKSTGGDCPPQDVNPPPGGGTGDPTNPGDPGDGSGGGEPGGGSYKYQCFPITTHVMCSANIHLGYDSGCTAAIPGATYTSEICDWVWVQDKSLKSTTTCDDPDGPVGVLPDPSDPLITDECNKIKDYTDSTKHDAVPALMEILGHANSSAVEHGCMFEMGFEYGPDPTSDDGTYTYNTSSLIIGNADNIEFTLSTGVVSTVHSHPVGKAPVPSFGDLVNLLETYESSTAANPAPPLVFRPFVRIFVVMPGGVAYSLSVKDIATLSQKTQDKLDSPKYSQLATVKEKIEAIHNEMALDLQTVLNKEKYFMQKFGDYGINVSRSDPNNFDNWTILELNNAGVKETPCN